MLAGTPLFAIAEDRTVGAHRYVRVEPVDPGTLPAEMAPRVTGRYFDELAARERLARAAEELTMFDTSRVQMTEAELEEAVEAAVGAERDAVLPASWRGDRPQVFDVQRSEFGEIIAAEVLSRLFGTVVPASRISHKETPDQQSRGADVLGWENPTSPELLLILSEVKGSQASASPPSVIDDMATKLGQLLKDRRALTQELIWLRDHANDEHRDLCARACAMFLLNQQIFAILVAPVLVRTRSTVKPQDAGIFETDADSFGCPIRFVTVVVDGDLFDLASEVYRLAREAPSAT